MADVDVFLNEEWPALGDSEALEKQLEQCTVSQAHARPRDNNHIEFRDMIPKSTFGLHLLTRRW